MNRGARGKLYAYFSSMIRLVLCGTGNVARHLFDAFQTTAKVNVVQVAGRNQDALVYFGSHTDITGNFSRLKKADIYLLAVSDSAIESVARNIKDGLVVHCSGSTSIDRLPTTASRGVFYPLQTFSKEMQVNLENIPLCLEAENEADYQILEVLARTISGRAYRVNSEKRLGLHLAAVFVNNFTNHLFQVGQTICEQKGLSFDMLLPLIDETIRKINLISPFEAQTGPARRNDVHIQQLQLEELENKAYQAIYKTISESIQATYAEKL
ncbi:MAG: Rossmann-like and DUF2520 domain-containing protein [Flavobacteriaceae bacterium]